jgi:phosphosulfolactate synthase
MQNFASGGAGAPQDGQRRSSCAPHDIQNFASAGFALPQVLQVRSIARNSSVREPSRRPTVIWVTPCTGDLITCAPMPDFLDLPERPPKPRSEGITHVVDTGLSVTEAASFADTAGEYVDFLRLGWGTAYVTSDLEAKIAAYRSRGIPVLLGGTLTELVWAQGRIDEFSAWLRELGIEHVEVSSGTVQIPAEEKAALIEKLAADFTVFAEVGEKDPQAILAPYRWIALIREALEAGATQVVCEGRVTGDAGMYRPDGEPRTGLIDEIVHEIDQSRLIFEAPRKHQQVRFIEVLGPQVNLGNVLPEDALSLETLRLGLRADTLKLFHQKK